MYTVIVLCRGYEVVPHFFPLTPVAVIMLDALPDHELIWC